MYIHSPFGACLSKNKTVFRCFFTKVSSLLESAGFSKANPYYIVQQGKVSTLTLMKDAERLNLLKEVAGTKVTEDNSHV